MGKVNRKVAVVFEEVVKRLGTGRGLIMFSKGMQGNNDR